MSEVSEHRDWDEDRDEDLREVLELALDYLDGIDARLARIESFVTPPAPPKPGPPTSFTVLILDTERDPITMADQIVVTDSTPRSAVVVFHDAKGNVTAAPSGALASYTSSDPAVLSVDAPTGALTVAGSVGKAEISAAPTHADGSPILGPDGVTPITGTPDEVDVIAGPPASFAVAVK